MSYGFQVRDSNGNLVVDLGYSPFDYIETLTLSAGDVGSINYSSIPGTGQVMVFLHNVLGTPEGNISVVSTLGKVLSWNVPSNWTGTITVGVYRGVLL